MVAPMDERILPDQRVQGERQSRQNPMIVPAVITCKTKEGAHLRGCLRGQNVPDGSQERRIWQKTLLCHPMTQVTDLLGSECALCGVQLEFGVPQPLKYLA